MSGHQQYVDMQCLNSDIIQIYIK